MKLIISYDQWNRTVLATRQLSKAIILNLITGSSMIEAIIRTTLSSYNSRVGARKQCFDLEAQNVSAVECHQILTKSQEDGRTGCCSERKKEKKGPETAKKFTIEYMVFLLIWRHASINVSIIMFVAFLTIYCTNNMRHIIDYSD
ncbi:hypothetical protein GQX74_013709 [Glossina fuscipes]|nr:hypothetical protein GQX74_013709 [Glossina fuscipes]